MKNKTYRHGKASFRAYCKPAGSGYEVGLINGGKALHIGNFINSADANKWYAQMNKEIVAFGKKYKVTTKFPLAWYKNFLGHTLNKKYFTFCDKIVNKHQKKFKTAVNKDVKKYKSLKKRLPKAPVVAFKRAA